MSEDNRSLDHLAKLCQDYKLPAVDLPKDELNERRALP